MDSGGLKALLAGPDALFVQIWAAISHGTFVTSQMTMGVEGMKFDLDMSTTQGRLGWLSMFIFWVCMGIVTMHRKISAARTDRAQTKTEESRAKTARLQEQLNQANIQKEIDLATQIQADTEITVLKLNKIKRESREIVNDH